MWEAEVFDDGDFDKFPRRSSMSEMERFRRTEIAEAEIGRCRVRRCSFSKHTLHSRGLVYGS